MENMFKEEAEDVAKPETSSNGINWQQLLDNINDAGGPTPSYKPKNPLF
jgi:hypothetical protein